MKAYTDVTNQICHQAFALRTMKELLLEPLLVSLLAAQVDGGLIKVSHSVQ